MNLRLSLCLSLLALGAVASAQSTLSDARARKSDEILTAMRKVEILNQLLPLLLEKDQIKKLLPQLEKVRAKVNQTVQKEHEELLKLESRSKNAVKEGVEQRKLPPMELSKDIAAFYAHAQVRRQAIAAENIATITPVFKAMLNPGQLKAATNSLTLKYYEPNVKPEQVTDDLRLQVFVREVILDPLAYDLLVQLAK